MTRKFMREKNGTEGDTVKCHKPPRRREMRNYKSLDVSLRYENFEPTTSSPAPYPAWCGKMGGTHLR